ncbi:electron transport complex protein RnfB [Geothermobacter ehrlichii]|uniref:Ion-translocating oxidoreductase complex subunit B n=1 Tax=Geothermobacter ehrlichii TaxID=213224 RepID=A0A5D3WHW7_9BACT|nr:RnfABCDGE type electron transport complex subunit B [Geothermobacter ehrlichii]TYO95462.1 electron transport complex protein RnfB [Geothermobacter ehrlichii]
MIAAVTSLGGIGLLAALALGAAARKFAVEVDQRESAIIDVLSGANCGACGYPGCGAYAKAVVEDGVSPSLCTPGGQGTVEAIARIMGVEAEAAVPQVAVVRCQGDNRKAKEKYRYLGLADCNAAQKLADGPKACPGGCLGLGSCERACPFGAIEMTADGLAVISREKCTGCRKCVAVCPRQVIAMAPREATVHVLCNSHDKGAAVRKYCEVGCIACQICRKTAPEAYVIEDFLARVVYEHHEQAGPGVEKCPTRCIRDFRQGYPEGSSFRAPGTDVSSDVDAGANEKVAG